MKIKLWSAELTGEEWDRAGEETRKEMIEDLEAVWGRMKDAMLKERG